MILHSWPVYGTLCEQHLKLIFCHLLTGNVSRVCYENTTWAEPDVSDCQSRQFQGLKETVRYCWGKFNHIFDKYIKLKQFA